MVRTEARYTYSIGQTVMRFAGERQRAERAEEDENAGQGEIIGRLHLLQDCAGSRQHVDDAERAERDGVAAHGSGRPSAIDAAAPRPRDPVWYLRAGRGKAHTTRVICPSSMVRSYFDTTFKRKGKVGQTHPATGTGTPVLPSAAPCTIQLRTTVIVS